MSIEDQINAIKAKISTIHDECMQIRKENQKDGTVNNGCINELTRDMEGDINTLNNLVVQLELILMPRII